MVSRYTCGFKKVKTVATDIVGKRPFKVDASISIVLLDLIADFNLNNPYPVSQTEDKPKRIFKFWLMKLFKKNDIPATPMQISRASESAQNKAM